MLALIAGLLGGCGNAQPYVSPDRMQRGLLLVLPGIEGRSSLNEEICRGLNEGGVNCAIELYDWTSMLGPLWNLRASNRNHRQARDIADYIRSYRRAYPKAPVYLVGQSGGAAIAVWTAERLGPSEPVDGIILLAASLSPRYNLSGALRSSNKGIISFYSHRDWLLLGTNLVGTMDGELSSSAGRTGFEYPGPTIPPPSYHKLVQVGWNTDMAGSGNTGGHLTSGAAEYMAGYVAPFISAPVWNEAVKASILKAEAGLVAHPDHAAPPGPATRPATTRPATSRPTATPKAQPIPLPEIVVPSGTARPQPAPTPKATPAARPPDDNFD